MTFFETRTWLEQTLSKAGIESAQAEARWLLEHLFLVTSPSTDDSTKPQQNSVSLLPNVNLELNSEQLNLLQCWLERRIRREPLQHILGIAPFYGLELIVNNTVLIPRPETERLVEIVLEHIKSIQCPRVLDVGTGSGAIALVIKHEHPDALVMATDISAQALKVAKQNAEKYGLELSLVESDLLSSPEVQTFANICDVLVANLPYLPESDKHRVSLEVLHDPELALYSGADGLDLFRQLNEQAIKIVKEGCFCFFELDPRNAATIRHSWRQQEVLEDLVGRNRFLKVQK